MALKKSELYTSLWASCDELRGGMDASQYKNWRTNSSWNGRRVRKTGVAGWDELESRWSERKSQENTPARHEHEAKWEITV